MRALPTDLMRRFVIAMLEAPTIDYGACAARAGYSPGGTRESWNATGGRLAHDERVLEAIQEEARNRMASGAIYAVTRLLEIITAGSAAPGVQLRAIEMLLNRVGLHALVEMKTTHNLTLTDDNQLIQKITGLAAQLGINPKVLLGRAGVVDAEFSEVKQIESQPDDLSDILG